MGRNKYIRFFISSTFEDMKQERNLLQGIFDELAKKYAKKGWQIENVDLRWGITREASLDNKTMQICLAELKRCQDLSPKPNFIILMGDRYGWIPLPEIISPSEIETKKLSQQEISIFKSWYKLDRNAIPAQYILQKRSNISDDDWKDKVERPLASLFKRHHIVSYGSSATEHEILQGAINAKDASEHAIAFIRHFKNIPQDKQKDFSENSTENVQKLEKIKNKVCTTLSSSNQIIFNDIEFSIYETTSYAERFKTEMLKTIENVVRHTIEENKIDDLIREESEAQDKIRELEGNKFVGRIDILNEIDNYVNDITERRALHIMSASGYGKTALLAKIATTYQSKYFVVCEFCGQTKLSSDGGSLFWVISSRLLARKRNTLIAETRRGWDVANAIKDFSKQQSGNKDCKPLLLIIDGINQTEDISNDLLKLKWLGDGVLPNNVKIIFSSTNELKYHFSANKVRRLSLSSMGDDSLLLVKSILDNEKRTLTKEQQNAVRYAIEHSNKSAIYLHVLGLYLLKKESWCNLNNVPTSLGDLVNSIIDEIYETGYYNKLFVKEILSLLCIERVGLSQTEILDIISNNTKVFSSICHDSFHQISGHRIPVALWSHLYASLTPFIRTQFSKFGNIISIYHQSLRDEIANKILYSNYEKAVTSFELYSYYLSGFRTRNVHAISELIFQGYLSAINYRGNNNESYQRLKDSLYQHLTSASYIASKILYSYAGFFSDYTLCEELYDDNVNQEFIRIKNESIEIEKTCYTEEECVLFLKALPTNFVLRKIADKSSSSIAMKNILADITPYTKIIHLVNDLGESPQMSEDGNLIASLEDNCHKIVIQDLRRNCIIKEYTMKEEILDMEFDDSFRYNLIRTNNYILIYDNVEKKNIYSFSTKDTIWYSMCKQKPIIVIGEASDFYICYMNGEKISYHVSSIAGSISPTGNYIWLIEENYHMYRFDINKDLALPFGIIENAERKHKTSIISSSDESCAFIHDYLYIYHHYTTEKGENKFLVDKSYYFGTEEKIIFSSNEATILKYIDDLCEITSFNDNENDTHTLNCIEKNHVHGLYSVNRDLTLALIRNDNLSYICDFRIELGIYTPAIGGNSGINTLSCSNDGKEIVLSSGINPGGMPGDRNPDVLRISNRARFRWHPSHEDAEHIELIAANAVSPNRKIIATSIYRATRKHTLNLTLAMDNKCISSTLTDNECCSVMSFSADSKYLLSLTGLFLNDKGYLILLDSQGNIMQKHDMKDSPCSLSLARHIQFSNDNRFAIATAMRSGGFYDIIAQEDIFLDERFSLCDIDLYKGTCFKTHNCTVRLPFCSLVLANDKNGYLCFLDLYGRTYIQTRILKTPIGCSATGRYIFFLKDNVLSMGIMPLIDNTTIDLLHDVKWIVPAYDDDHIFVTTTKDIILLYDIKKKQIKQKAYFGLAVFQRLCSKGLVVAIEGSGKIALFEPDIRYGVNTPAIATFVRHWNLKTKQLESPTAICPMCGYEIKITHKIRRKLKVVPHDLYNKQHWENSKLFGHHCPNCNAELRFNPYIVNEQTNIKKGCFISLIATMAYYITAYFLCSIDPEETYSWYSGLWHGFFGIPNLLMSFCSDSICFKAPNCTTMYTICFYISLFISCIVGSLLRIVSEGADNTNGN